MKAEEMGLPWTTASGTKRVPPAELRERIGV
jgi:hypothetical protein